MIHIKDLSPTVSKLDFPDIRDIVWFVYLSDSRLYTAADDTLYVHSITDLASPIVSYPLGDRCRSGLIIKDRLYLGGGSLYVFKVTASLSQPLIPVTVITTKKLVYKILRAGNELLLG
jgi:hypothetical protein